MKPETDFYYRGLEQDVELAPKLMPHFTANLKRWAPPPSRTVEIFKKIWPDEEAVGRFPRAELYLGTVATLSPRQSSSRLLLLHRSCVNGKSRARMLRELCWSSADGDFVAMYLPERDNILIYSNQITVKCFGNHDLPLLLIPLLSRINFYERAWTNFFQKWQFRNFTALPWQVEKCQSPGVCQVSVRCLSSRTGWSVQCLEIPFRKRSKSCLSFLLFYAEFYCTGMERSFQLDWFEVERYYSIVDV